MVCWGAAPWLREQVCLAAACFVGVFLTLQILAASSCLLWSAWLRWEIYVGQQLVVCRVQPSAAEFVCVFGSADRKCSCQCVLCGSAVFGVQVVTPQV
jgi:hypothetical protein